MLEIIAICCWATVGLGFAIATIRQADKDGVGEDFHNIGQTQNKIANFITVGVVLVIFVILGPLLLFYFLRK